jgi:hypothetical protein
MQRVHGKPTWLALHLTFRSWQGMHALDFLTTF